ncbi:large ribosomal subunit protein uL10m-like [Ylistrum balloti]|uniref:large ribosomal subunit protein uL10m-like n=1 Tax=Ylistrum balloti TaxID=509963 RepID=UPI002905F1FC|nr:large ribosomal subunit protein uL10m-like [Ylistrum balloti]
MASLVKSTRVCLAPVCRTWSQQVRMKHKFNSKKPWKNHRSHKYRIFQAVTQPLYVHEDYPVQTCPRLERKKNLQENADDAMSPAEEFIYRGCEHMFQENKMIIVCQVLPCPAVEVAKAKGLLLKFGLKLKVYSNKYARMAVTGTELENMKPWFQGRNVFLVSEEQNIAAVVKNLRKIPFLLMLGGLVDGRLLTKEGIMTLSKLPPIEELRGELCSILNMAAGGRTLSLLDTHQQTLATNLDQLVKQGNTDPSSEEGVKNQN